MLYRNFATIKSNEFRWLSVLSLYLEKLALDEEGILEKKENLIVANEEFAMENKNILNVSNKLAEYFTDESL